MVNRCTSCSVATHRIGDLLEVVNVDGADPLHHLDRRVLAVLEAVDRVPDGHPGRVGSLGLMEKQKLVYRTAEKSSGVA